jgi:phosphate transport system permease protein
MDLNTRKALDRSLTVSSIAAVLLLAAALIVILAPIFARGMKAFCFQGTVEFRRLQLQEFKRGDVAALEREWQAATAARAPVYEWTHNFEAQLKNDADLKKKYGKAYKDLQKVLTVMLGPVPGEKARLLMRDQYGQTRWDRACLKAAAVLQKEEWDYSNPGKAGVKVIRNRADDFKGTSLVPLFGYVETHLDAMFLPKRTFYWRFLTDESYDSHFFGGIWPELLGTIYLTIGAMIFAIPMGIVSAVYLAEYAPESRLVGLLRSCISTLAGVPSIVFGLFGLAFFINTLHLSQSKSVLVGALTLGLMVLPTMIRASEEALRSVPSTYKAAALSLGAGHWHAVWTVLLPAALPGILTGIVISMGRAAGETAPIIFTAAVSVGKPLCLLQTLTEPTPALSWNIFNISTEHAAVDEIRHVQYGMVVVLVTVVLLLNLTAIIVRARVSNKLRG